MNIARQYEVMVQAAKAGDEISSTLLEYWMQGHSLWPDFKLDSLSLRALQTYGQPAYPLSHTRVSKRFERRLNRAILNNGLNIQHLGQVLKKTNGSIDNETKTINLYGNLSRRQRLDTLLHEFSHANLDHGIYELDRGKQEAEACWVTQAVFSIFGYNDLIHVLYKLHYTVGNGYLTWSFNELSSYINDNLEYLNSVASSICWQIVHN